MAVEVCNHRCTPCTRATPVGVTAEPESKAALLHLSCCELQFQIASPRNIWVPMLQPCSREARHYISRNCKDGKVLESAVPLNFAFNICSPINLCLLQVNRALRSGSALRSSPLCPWQLPAPRSPSAAHRAPGPAAGTAHCVPKPRCSPDRPSQGFFFLIVFKTDFMWSQNETVIVN